MIVQRLPDEITGWFVVFFRVAQFRWANRVPGPFKHVAAVGWSEACRTWVVYDVTLLCTRVYVFPDGPLGWPEIERWLGDAAVLRVTRGDHRLSLRARLGFWCVPAIRHLVRSRCGALTPTGFYHGLIAEGATIVRHGLEQQHVRRACAA